MHTLRKLTDAELSAAYESVFREAFPPEELKPLFVMEQMRSEAQYEALGLFVEGEPRGFICCWLDEPYVLIDYLCVERGRRNSGLGAEILKKIQAYYPAGTVFIGEVEALLGEPEEDAIRARRLDFYARCGAKSVGYDCALFGVHYKTIVWASGEVDERELMSRHDGFYRRNFSPELYASAIQLPLKAGEKPFDRRAWEQRPDSE